VVVKRTVEKARLDDIFAGRHFDFVKIDTQGSELDVILGGEVVLARADYILVEVSLVEYNIGGARAEAIFAALDALGFHCTEVTDFHRLAGVQNGNLLQMDFLFERRGLARRATDTATLEGICRLADSLRQEGRREEALLLLNHLRTLEPGDAVLRQCVNLLSAMGQTLKALDALTELKAAGGNVEDLLGAIRAQMPAILECFNAHLAAGEIEQAEKYAAALAGLLPGNVAVLDSALSCNLALGRSADARKYAAGLLAIEPNHSAARALLNPANPQTVSAKSDTAKSVRRARKRA
jgi:hypothetical protein